MATSNFKKVPRSYGGQKDTATVTFTTVNDAAPTVTDRRGVVSVTRTGEGVFEILLLEGGDVLKANARVLSTTLTDGVTITAIAPTTNKVTVTTLTTVTASDIPGAIVMVDIDIYQALQIG